MAQTAFTLTDTPQAVAGPGAAMFQGRDAQVKYWVGSSLPASTDPAFLQPMGKREPLNVPDGENLYLAGSGYVTVYTTGVVV